MPGDVSGFTQFGYSIGRSNFCVFHFLADLVTGSGAILFGVIPLIRGDGCGPCVHPCTF
jgi:hypothetical protein